MHTNHTTTKISFLSLHTCNRASRVSLLKLLYWYVCMHVIHFCFLFVVNNLNKSTGGSVEAGHGCFLWSRVSHDLQYLRIGTFFDSTQHTSVPLLGVANTALLGISTPMVNHNLYASLCNNLRLTHFPIHTGRRRLLCTAYKITGRKWPAAIQKPFYWTVLSGVPRQGCHGYTMCAPHRHASW